MSKLENFVSRWSRLKREADPEKPREAASVAPSDAVAINLADETADLSSPTFDPASLPSIDSITADTDIRVFLQSGVPARLTEAALRRAWHSDPLIRDFIGIADNQWDFSDPTAIPGFGPLRQIDDVPGRVAQAAAACDRATQQASDGRISAANAMATADNSRFDDIRDRDREQLNTRSTAATADEGASAAAPEDKSTGGTTRHDLADG
jgi:hypothetical protein